MNRRKTDEGETKKPVSGLESGPYQLVDDDFQAQAVYLHAPKKRDVAEGLGGWMIAWQEASMELAKDKRMGLTDWRVLAVLQSRLDYENWIRLSLAEIGEPIGVAKPHVSKSMKKLLELGVVLPGPCVKTVKTYRLNPSIGWKGTLMHGATERRKALRVVTGGKAAKEDASLPAG